VRGSNLPLTSARLGANFAGDWQVISFLGDAMVQPLPRLPRSCAKAGLTIAALFAGSGIAIGQGSDARFLVPPRTIADITAILDQEKPDSQRLAKLRAEADAVPPKGAERSALAMFHFKRAQVRTELGRIRDGTADTEKAIELGRGQGVDVARLKQL
jgi:hypothetical protein